MPDLQTVLQAHHQTADGFLTAARAVSPKEWSQPRAPGKWSRGQVVEHVTLAYEVNRGLLHGSPPPMKAPRWIRPVIRRFLLQPVLQRGRFFPGSKSPQAFRPGPVPAAPDRLLGRLEAAVSGFETDAKALSATTIDHPFFGHLPLTDFVQLQEIHTRHHLAQLA
jgi:hypothetical protein